VGIQFNWIVDLLFSAFHRYLLRPKCTCSYTEKYIRRGCSTHIRAFGHLNAASRCARTIPKNYFLNIVKFNVQIFFYVICLMHTEASLLRYLTESLALLDAAESAQSNIAFLALGADTSLLPTCRTNAAVHSLVWGGWRVMMIDLL
jgi:hypothetical protein